MNKQDIRKINNFALTDKGDKVVLHSPRGSNVVINKNEIGLVIELLTKTSED